MRFALIDNKQTEAKTGLRGICPGCLQPVVAKCGERKIHHWAHKSNKMCDSWWEPETEWHRSWKDNFPRDWQEVFLPDEQTGEKHIADIQTSNGFVIEFQHSPIHPQERQARERFYKNMVWVVDGTRLKRDCPRFLKGRKDFCTIRKGLFRVDMVNEYFPPDWTGSSVAIIFDFKGLETIPDATDPRNTLYCLFPERLGRYGILAEVSRATFIKTVISGEWMVREHRFREYTRQFEKEINERAILERRIQTNMAFQRFMGIARHPRRRRL